MKTMKRIVVALLGIIMMLSLAACGAEKTVTLRGDMTNQMGGTPATDTWTLTAKGDTIQTMKEVVEIDLSAFDDATKEYMVSALDSAVPATDIDGVVYTCGMQGDTYVMNLSVDCTVDNAVKGAVDAGLLTVDGNAKRISLKATQAELEKQGFVVQ